MLLSVGIITYNHEHFIRECIDSILSQITNFEFEIVIGDDNSTDNTQNILLDYANKYPEQIKLILNEENKGISYNNHSVISACNGKYIALLEGDDFWIDTRKIQQQVDFLESNPEYGFVGSNTTLLYPGGTLKEDATYSSTQSNKWILLDNVFDNCKYGPITRTATICFRKSIISPYLNITEVGNDMVLQCILSKHSKFAKLNKATAVYRLSGVSNSTNFQKQILYNQWYVKNCMILHQLFPYNIPFDADSLDDRETYILLKQAIYNNIWKDALKEKKRLKTSTYKRKKYARFLYGPLSCNLLRIHLIYFKHATT